MFYKKLLKITQNNNIIYNMVKNSNGGCKAKKFASKSFIVSNRATRFSSDPDEVYAIVTKLMGGNICEVLCIVGLRV